MQVKLEFREGGRSEGKIAAMSDFSRMDPRMVWGSVKQRNRMNTRINTCL